MSNLVSHLGLKGRVMIELVDDDGHKTYHEFNNNVRDNLREAVAAAIAQQTVAFPSHIQLGDGVPYIREYSGSSGQDTNLALNATDQQQLAQYLYVGGQATNYSYWRGVMLWMKRIGSPAGTIHVEIETTSLSGDLSVVTGTPLTNGITTDVNCLSLSTSYDWVTFWFDADALPAKALYPNIILKSTGYTYSAGVTEVVWGADGSSPDATTGLMSKYNGSAWSQFSPDTQGIFRMIAAALPGNTQVNDQTLAITKAITGRSRQNRVAARLLASFSKSEGNDWIRQVGLLTPDSTLAAVANVSFLKTSSQILNVYWIIEVD